MLAIGLGAAVLVAALAGWWTATGPASEPAAPPITDGTAAIADGPSLVVLPFANLSGDTGQDHVARGLAEEILIDLTRFKELVLFGRDSGFQHDDAADVREIGRDLGVRYVLLGAACAARPITSVSPANSSTRAPARCSGPRATTAT